MAKYAELPDGTRLEFPDDTQDSVIDSVVKKHLGISDTAGVVESAKGALKRGLASAETAITAPFVGGEEAGIKGLEAQKAIEERPGFSWDEIKRKYEQEGVLPAAGEAISQIPGTIAEQAPTLGAIFTGGRIGAALGSAIPGVGTVAGGIGGAALYPFLTQSGANIERQVQEQQAQGEPVDVSLGKAYGAGLVGTGLEMIGGPEAFLAKRIGNKAIREMTAEELQALAKQGTAAGLLRGTGRVMAEEVPTEIAQQALERAQAGLPISPTDQQALDEYLASGVGAALAGPVGGPMRLMERSAARDQLAADEQKKQAEEEAQRQAVYEQERQIAEREAIKQEAYDAMLEKVKGTQVGENVDLFNAPTPAETKAAKARTQEENMRLFGTPTAPQEEIQTPAEEIPSQGGSANLMMQQAMKEAEQQTAIDKANRERGVLYGAPEDGTLFTKQQKDIVEAEPFKAIAEQKVADIQSAQQETAQNAITAYEAKPSAANIRLVNQAAKDLNIKGDLQTKLGQLRNVMQQPIAQQPAAQAPEIKPVEQPEAPQAVEPLQLPKAFAKPLSEQASQHVADNNFSGLLTSLGETHENEDVKKILNKINGLGLNTKIQTGDISGAGEYDPNTNTITFNPNTGLNEHTVIHEPVHAAIAHVLDNADHPLTKAFDTLYQQVKSKLGDQYGGTNLQEFASEAVSNPDFQDLLKKTKANNGGNLFQRMIDAVARFFGFRKEQSAYDRAFKHINDIIDVSHEVPRTGGEKLAHVGNDADLKAATQMYAPPKKAEEPSMQQRVERAKESALGFSVKKAVHDLRTAVAHSGAPIQKHYQEKYNGAMRDALSKEISGHFLFDAAQDSSHFAAASIDQGVLVFENGVPKVKKDPNNIANAMRLMKAFGDRIGSQEDANHAVQAYMLAQNYDRILRNNAKIEKQIEDLKATGKTADKNKAKKLQDFIAKVNAEQVAGIKPGLEYANRHPEIKKIADMWEAIKNADVDFQEKSGTISKELADKYRNDPGYVPMYRVMNEMDAENPGTREYYRGLADVKAEKHFTGSDKDVKNIFDNMTARHMWAVESAIRNYANKRLSEDLGIVGENGETKYYSTQPTGKADTTAPVWINGKRKWVEYADPTFVTALKGVEPIASPLIKALGGASRLLRTSVTAMPTFQLVQILKDAPRAAMLSGVDHPFELMGRVIKDAGVLYADMVSGRDNPILKEMERAGISSGYGHTAEEINDRMRRQLGLEANSKVKQALDMVEKIAAISDAAQRKAVYEQTLKETGDRDLAEDRARNIINWKRHGANHNVRVLAQIVPFMNAYIQSMDVLLSAMTGTGISGKEKAAARRQFASTWGQLMVLSAIYAMVVADDEDYQKMDDKKKLNSLVIPGTGVHIPVASEIGLLVKALPELGYQYITREGTNNPLDATKLRGAVGNAIGDALLSPNLTPQLLKPAVEVMTNHNFLTGTPLIGHSLERKATSEQFNESTSELAKLLGSTGLISPINADHLMKGYFGTMGSLGLSTLDSVVNQFSGIKRPADAWYKNPVISPFMNDPRFKDQVNGYYDLLKESDQVTLKLNDLKKSGRFEEAKEYRTEHAEMIRARSQINNLSNRMEKLREQHKKVVDSRMSADEKREKLDALDQRIGSILKNVNSLRVKAGL